MHRWAIGLLLAGLLAGPAGVAAAPLSGEQVFPGGSRMAPLVAQLGEEAALLAERLALQKKLATQQEQLRQLRQQQERLEGTVLALGDPQQWGFERLLELRASLALQDDSLARLHAALANQLTELETQRVDWVGKRRFWSDWPAALPEPRPAQAEGLAEQALAQIDAVLARLAEGFDPTLGLLQQVSSLQQQTQALRSRLDRVFNEQRRKVFSRTAPGLLSPAYWERFGPALWSDWQEELQELPTIPASFLRNQGWVLGLQLLVVWLVGLAILSYRRERTATPEWRFLLDSPLATGVFAALLFSGLYQSPPALWRLGLWTLAVIGVNHLLVALLSNPRKRLVVRLLSALLLTSMGLQLLAVPSPLYRLYLSLLCLFGVPGLLGLARANLRAKGGRMDGFTLALRVGALSLAGALIAQLGGFSNFAALLVEGTIKSVFVVLLAIMALRLGRGAIDFLLQLPSVQQQPFFTLHGQPLGMRLKWLLQLLVVVYAGLYLLPVWGLYEGVGVAWNDLLGRGFSWGEAQISLRMVLLALLVLYASIVLSWVLTALLESEWFPRRDFDLGVQTSIKKLLHYALVLVGFLLAMGLAGVELKNFAVLAGAFGIGVGFGLQNIINNFVSGLILLFERPIKVGDMVVLGDDWGTVKKIGLRSTVVETLDKSEIIVPNSELISQKVTNYTLSTTIARVVLPVGVAYGSDMQLVMEILKEAAAQQPDVLDEPAPSPIFKGFGDSSLDFELRVWIREVSRRFLVQSELGLYVDRRFREAGVTIPFPQRDLHLRSIDAAAASHWHSGPERERSGD